MSALKTILATATSFISTLGLRPIWSTKNTQGQPATLGKQAEEILNDNFTIIEQNLALKASSLDLFNLSSDIKTYQLGDSLTQTVLFGKMVRAIYTTGKVLTKEQSLRVLYLGFDAKNFGDKPFGIQIGLVENGVISKETNYVYQYSVDLKNNAILQLTPIGGGELATDLKVYVVLSNQYESLVTPSFDSTVVNLTQQAYNWYLDPLLKNYIDSSLSTLDGNLTSNIVAATTGGYTYQVILQHAYATIFKSFIEEIYITGANSRANRKFHLVFMGTRYSAFNSAPLGVQISVKKIDGSAWERATNYFLSGTLTAGQTYKMSTNDPAALLGVDVYLKLASTFITPVNSAIYPIESVIELTPLSWNNFIPLPIQSFINGKATEIIVSADINDTEAAFKGANCIQLALNSITDASATNRYLISYKQGLAKITNSSQFLGNPGYPAMIVPKDHVDIVGQSREDCIIHAELPYNDSEIDTAIIREKHQTMYNWANDCVIENLTLVSKYIRYTLHQDSSYETNGTRRYKNCGFEFLGDRGYDNALGIGTYSGSRTFVEGGYSKAYTHPPVAIHNNQNFKKPSEWHFEKHEFINSKGDAPGFIYMSVCGSLLSDKLELIGCSFGSSYVFNYAENWIYTPNKNDSFNHAEWRITGHGNAPFYFNNMVKGLSLRIDATTSGANIVIDPLSTAYASLLKNPHSYFGHLGHPERYRQEGHVKFYTDGILKTYIIGGLSIYEGAYPGGTIQSVDNLGKRLGDCSVVNKELKLTVGVTALTIIFNKNYTNMTNAAIIAEMNTALGAYAVASEYNISLDYYPEITDVMSICVNGTGSVIAKGTPVKQVGDRIFPATEGSVLFGISLDDIAAFSTYRGEVRGYGRVLTRGYISTLNTERHFAEVDSQSTSYKVGNGTLIADANGSLKAIASGIVGINV